MCGIAGLLDSDAVATGLELDADIAKMLAAIRHRGPDASGIWADPAAGVGLGVQRLAVVGPPPHGGQPMVSPCGRYVLAFNGEIYNHDLLRGELRAKGESFVGSSDTEVLLRLISTRGIDATLDQVDGMFAIAVWDRHERQLDLVRDRLGEKPLHYGWIGRRFWFASELKGLLALGNGSPPIDRRAVMCFVRDNHVPAPLTIFLGASKLAGGEMATVSLDHHRGDVRLRTYWSAQHLYLAGAQDPFTGTAREAEEALGELLDDAVRRRMRADVAVGALLSGGVDSSAVVASMQKSTSEPIPTFTVGFEGDEPSDTQAARAVATDLGTDHQSMIVTGADALQVVTTLPNVYDEPFADPSQVPTLFLARMASERVTVALSGDGSDELFGGYQRYADCAAAWERMARDGWWGRLTELVGRRGVPRDREAFYFDWLAKCRRPSEVLLGSEEPCDPVAERAGRSRLPFATWMMSADLAGYLPDYILTKMDRASMAHSLEVRAPFLDRRIVELASRLPLEMKVGEGTDKRVVRRLLARRLPSAAVRPKCGFDPPLARWLSGPLREWAEDLLGQADLRREGVFDPAVVRRRWQEQLDGRRDRSFHVWSLLMFRSWSEAQRPITGTRRGAESTRPSARTDERSA